MPNTFRSGNNDNNNSNGGEFGMQPPNNFSEDDLVPDDNQPAGPTSTVDNGTSSLLTTQSRNMDAFGNYSEFLNSNGNLTTNRHSGPATIDTAGERREALGLWDPKEDDDYVPIEEQCILREVPQSPEHIDKLLKDLNKLNNQGLQNLYGAQVPPCQTKK